MILDSKDSKNAAELPPNYELSTGPVIYTFSNWAKGTGMLLMPPKDAVDQRPLYRVTVEIELNPLLPVSYNTKLYRGAGRDMELLGEFAFALNHKRAVIRLKDTTTRLSSALYSVNSNPRHFNWILENRLHWDCRTSLGDGSPVCICYLPPNTPSQPSNNGSSYSSSSHPHQSSSNNTLSPTHITNPRNSMARTSSVQIARFITPPIDASPPLPDATLTVFPEGRTLMDEIVMSALVVIRMLNR